MRVLLSTYGSRGDVEPLVALAVQLQALGAEVRMCAPPDEEFTELLAREGVSPVPFDRPWRSGERPLTAEERQQAPSRPLSNGAGGLRVTRSRSPLPREGPASFTHPILPSSTIVSRRRYAPCSGPDLRNQRRPTPLIKSKIKSQEGWPGRAARRWKRRSKLLSGYQQAPSGMRPSPSSDSKLAPVDVETGVLKLSDQSGLPGPIWPSSRRQRRSRCSGRRLHRRAAVPGSGRSRG